MKLNRESSRKSVELYKEMIDDSLRIKKDPKNEALKVLKDSLTFADIPYRDGEECKNEKDEDVRDRKKRDDRYDGVIISMNPLNINILKIILKYLKEEESLNAKLIDNKIVIKDKFKIQHKN